MVNRVVVTLAAACLFQLTPAQAQKKVGAPYSAREPETCASTKEPAKGVVSSEVAKHYVRCHIEGVGPGNNLMLVENLKVEVGKGTPFLQLDGGQRPYGADVDGLVYSIRGSYTSYQCAVPSAISNNFGKNCNTYENKHATGQCYRTGFGDWSCNMLDMNAINDPDNRINVAPPK